MKHHADDLFHVAIRSSSDRLRERRRRDLHLWESAVSRKPKQTKTEQKTDLAAIFEDRTKSWKSLDYVSGWFMKAADYWLHTDAISAFVSTNSICQGQQVPYLMAAIILNLDHEIPFAHTSFKWDNLASQQCWCDRCNYWSGEKGSRKATRILSETDGETQLPEVENINPYLSLDQQNIFVSSRSNQVSDLPEMLSGDKMTDGGNLDPRFIRT